jgi:uncharacterized phage-associated protein
MAGTICLSDDSHQDATPAQAVLDHAPRREPPPAVCQTLRRVLHSGLLASDVHRAQHSHLRESAVATVFDVAAYILRRQGAMTAMKLQKLVYYSQAWSLVWDERLLFDSRIEAWANGPVCPDLYAHHRGAFVVGPEWGAALGNPAALDATARETIDAVLKYYGDKHPQWLSDLTHAEDPWRNAREGLDDGERGHCQITPAAMAEYYESLAPDA